MKNIHRINGNIYITSDEEIKDGDWLIVNDEDVMQMKSSYDNDMSGEDIWVGDSLNGYATYKDNCKKIILTTDQDLIKDGVQAIDDEFLEWFVKNPSCEEVEVQCRYNFYAGKDLTHYKIIIPKQEPKKETLEEFMATLPYYGHCNHEYLEGVEEGAKWQQERMLKIMDTYADDVMGGCTLRAKEWFEQFKKK